jgi:hypothetical protein
MEVVKLASKKANESGGQVHPQELSTQMAHMIKLQEASDAKQKRMEHLQKQVLDHQQEMYRLQKASDANQEEMKQLQKQALDQQEEMKQLQKQAFDQQEEMKQLALDHHEEIKQLQIQALGQLAELRVRVKAVLTQTYELHEYPIPRLFVALPQDPQDGIPWILFRIRSGSTSCASVGNIQSQSTTRRRSISLSMKAMKSLDPQSSFSCMAPMSLRF